MSPGAAARAGSLFRETFGASPRWGFGAPGRVNLIGEHTDYNGGLVLPIAIDRRCVAVAGPSPEVGTIRVVSETEGGPVAIPADGSLTPDRARRELARWAWYVAGVAAGVRAAAGRELPGLELAICSDVPIGSGLSSSAALEVAVAGALQRAMGLELERPALARLCREAEHKFAGVPCGIMDQFAAVHGRAGHAMLIDCRTETVDWLPMPPGIGVLVLDSGVRHRLGDGEYASRRAACEAAARALGVASLRDADCESILRCPSLNEEQRRAALHVVHEIGRTAEAASLLRALSAGVGERGVLLADLGRLMAESHRSLRDDYRVSCQELDHLVAVSAAWPGVQGARMTGAGFGGCAIALIGPDAVSGLMERVRDSYRGAFGRDAACVVTAGLGRRGAGGSIAMRLGRGYSLADPGARADRVPEEFLMLSEFVRASEIVPDGLDGTKWTSLEPLYRELMERPIGSVGDLERLILDRSEVDAAASEAQSILYIRMTCHTSDAAANQAYEAFVEQVQPRLKEAGFELDRKITSSPIAAQLDPGRYRVYLRDLRVGVEIFRPENIPIETELSKLDQSYSQICGAMTVQFQGQERTLPQMTRYGEELDRAVREEAWRVVAQRRYRDHARIEEIYSTMVDLRQQVASNADFGNFRDFAFKAKRRFDYTPETCHAFAAGVEKVCVPAMRRINAQRAEALELKSLRPWDMQVDIHGRPPLRPFEDGHQMVSRAYRIFRRMDPSLGDLFASLCDAGSDPASGGCLDLETRPGKAPGGYQSNRDRIRKPFIFMNAAGLQRDVETIVHEAGHAFHSLLSRHDPLVSYRSEIPLEFAEVASMSMELVSHPFLDEFYSDADADRARRNHLEQMVTLLGWVAQIDQFQHWIYTAKGHTVVDRHRKWVELSQRFGPAVDWSGLEEFLSTGWHRVLHLFGMPFYYIEYGIAQLGAIQLWANYRKDPARAIADYQRALALGGSRPLPELFAAAGLRFDLGPAAIERLWGEVELELARLPA